MIQQFRNLNFLNVILLFLVIYVLRLGFVFDFPQGINSGFSETGNRLLLQHPDQSILSPQANIFLAGVVLFIQALLFNRILNEYNIINKVTFIPALIYVVVSSVFTPFLFLSPPLICNFFLLFLLFRILASYKDSSQISTMFDLGMVTAIATVIYFPFVLFLLTLWIALIIFRPFNWREWGAVLIGYLVIIFFLAVYYFWNNQLSNFIAIWKPLTEVLPVFVKVQPLDYIVLFPIAAGLILGTIQLRENFFKSYIQVRKTFIFLFNLFIIGVLAFYLKSDFRLNHFLVCVIPIATILSYYFVTASKRWFYETLFLLTLVFIIYFQFI
ncbi:DUF6427 family protein [Pseudopedobacter sp.]|uniref:DUF6427 family protein n=1 Tax=Pseudopedobacter sp. TaxID=1936787 RepID=UPI00333F7B6E